MLNQENKPKELSKKTALVFLILVVVIIVIGGVVLLSDDGSINDNNTQGNISTNINQVEFETEKFIFSDSNYSLELRKEEGKNQVLTMYDQLNNLSRIIDNNYDFNFEYGSFVWNNDKTKLYFISYIRELGYITFLYIDINDPDPIAATEIVYEDPDSIFNNQTEIIKIEESVLYLAIDGKQYSLDPAQSVDARPIPVD